MDSLYVRNMLSQGLGIPCWITDLGNGASAGDVGTFMQKTGFKKLWNLWDMDDVQRESLEAELSQDLEDGGEVVWPELGIEDDLGVPAWEPGESLTANARVEHEKPNSNEENHSAFNVDMTSAEGSALPVISPIHRSNLTQKSQLDLKNFILRHAKRLYEWTLVFCGDDTTPGDPLYIVTGRYETAACTMVGFEYQMNGTTSILVRSQPKHEDQPEDSLQLNFSRGEHRDTFISRVKKCRGGARDQCLYLQGFTLLPRNPPQSDLDPPAETITEPPVVRPSGTQPDKKPSFKAYALWLPRDARLVGCMKENNPSNLINRVLLEQTTAAFALTHDDDWRPILKGYRWDQYGVRRVLLNIDDCAPVVVGNQIAYFKDGWTNQPRSSPRLTSPPAVLKRPASGSPDRTEGNRLVGDRLIETVRRHMQSLPPPCPYLVPFTPRERYLAYQIFYSIGDRASATVPWYVAREHIQCTGFSKDEFFVFLNLTRGCAWGIRDGEFSPDMLIFGLRTAAFTINAKHGPLSTLDTSGSMPKVEVLQHEDPKIRRPIVRLTFEQTAKSEPEESHRDTRVATNRVAASSSPHAIRTVAVAPFVSFV